SAAIVLTGLTFGLTASASTPTKSGALTDDAVRQAQLKDQFARFREKLMLLAGRLEAGPPADQARAKSLRKAIDYLRQRETAGRFDTIIGALTSPGADGNIDVLRKALGENAELRRDLRELIALLNGAGERDRDRLAKITKLLDALKDLRNREERLRAL